MYFRSFYMIEGEKELREKTNLLSFARMKERKRELIIDAVLFPAALSHRRHLAVIKIKAKKSPAAALKRETSDHLPLTLIAALL